MSKKRNSAILSMMLLSVASCKTATLSGRHDIAQNIAQKAQFQKTHIHAEPFVLTSYEKLNNMEDDSIHIYIEGDGLAWLSRTQPSMNPTPTNPFALRLAAQDPHPNVIYIARPCQYSGKTDSTACDAKYWRSARYAPEVLKSYNNALDSLTKRFGNEAKFHLVGYSGGGTLATLLASQRDDIKTLRTVAGNLDHKAHSVHHNVSILKGSLNPPQYSYKLENIPQYHFIGRNDEIVPFSVYQSYANSFQNKTCLNFKVLNKDHTSEAWVTNWSDLLTFNVTCKTAHQT